MRFIINLLEIISQDLRMMYASGFFPLVSAVQRNSAAAAAAAALGCGGRPGGLDSADIDVDGDSDDNSVADIEIRPHHDDEDGDRRRRNGIYLLRGHS